MGQPIAVIEKPSHRRGVVRFETNRALTGMGHERYRAGDEVWGERPPDELARRLFAHGGVEGVHINGNIVTVDLRKGYTAAGLKEIVENLYIFYPPGSEHAVADPVTAGSESADVAEATAAAVPTDAEGTEHPESVVDTAATHDPAGPAAADSELAEAEAETTAGDAAAEVEGDVPGGTTEAEPALATSAGDAVAEVEPGGVSAGDVAETETDVASSSEAQPELAVSAGDAGAEAETTAGDAVAEVEPGGVSAGDVAETETDVASSSEAQPELAVSAGDAAAEAEGDAPGGTAEAEPAGESSGVSEAEADPATSAGDDAAEGGPIPVVDENDPAPSSIVDATEAESATGSAPLPGDQSGPDDDDASAPI